jgi:hypothetical protein
MPWVMPLLKFLRGTAGRGGTAATATGMVRVWRGCGGGEGG